MCWCKRARSSSRPNLAQPFPTRIVHGVALAALMALGGTTGLTPPGQRKDCAAAYQAYVEALKRKKISPERLVVLHRWALRAYDACKTGDLEEDISDLLKRLERQNP
jgi:hypothetical protein